LSPSGLNSIAPGLLEEGKNAAQLVLSSYAALRGSWLVDSGFAVEVLAGACLRETGAQVARARAGAKSSSNVGGLLILLPRISLLE